MGIKYANMLFTWGMFLTYGLWFLNYLTSPTHKIFQGYRVLRKIVLCDLRDFLEASREFIVCLF